MMRFFSWLIDVNTKDTARGDKTTAPAAVLIQVCMPRLQLTAPLGGIRSQCDTILAQNAGPRSRFASPKLTMRAAKE